MIRVRVKTSNKHGRSFGVIHSRKILRELTDNKDSDHPVQLPLFDFQQDKQVPHHA